MDFFFLDFYMEEKRFLFGLDIYLGFFLCLVGLNFDYCFVFYD